MPNLEDIYSRIPENPTKEDIMLALEEAYLLGDAIGWAYIQDEAYEDA